MIAAPAQGPRRGDRGWRQIGGFLDVEDGWPGRPPEDLVADGDTLNCQCSARDAEAGLCHRGWAAMWLSRSGWRTVVDGVERDDIGRPVVLLAV